MRLKIKNLKWLAGKPIVVLHKKTSEKLNVFQSERVLLSNHHDFYAVADIFSKLVKEDEVGLSEETSKIFRLNDGDFLDVTAAIVSPAGKLIKKKIDGEILSEKEINTIITEIVNNNLTESEIAYFISAQKTKGMNLKEIIYLTKSMINTGGKLEIKRDKVVDKHCIGGVAGNRTTPIVVSICTAAGLTFPKTSSRAITSASGTADVIETIANIELSLDNLKKVINKTGGCLAWGGSLKLAPSDDKIIQVERVINLDVMPQMLASIMSKKISVGAKYILIDIPYGRGSKINSYFKARTIGRKFKKIAKYFNVKLECVYTSGTNPIGNGIGPVLEMLDVLKVLENKEDSPKDLRKKSIYLSQKLMKMAKIPNYKKLAIEILDSGKAYLKFKEIINAQNEKENFENKIKGLKTSKYKMIIKSKRKCKITEIKNNEINLLCRILGTPETKGSGVFMHKKSGKLDKGEKIITLYSDSRKKLNRAIEYFKKEKIIKVE